MTSVRDRKQCFTTHLVETRGNFVLVSNATDVLQCSQACLIPHLALEKEGKKASNLSHSTKKLISGFSHGFKLLVANYSTFSWLNTDISYDVKNITLQFL